MLEPVYMNEDHERQHCSQYIGGKYLFLQSGGRYEIPGTLGNRIMVYCSQQNFWNVSITVHSYLDMYRTATFSDAIHIAEKYADRYKKTFALSRIDAPWRQEPTYSFQKIVIQQLGHLNIRDMKTAGATANTIGTVLANR